MRNRFSLYQLVYLFLLVLLMTTACKKTETVTTYIQQPNALFTVQVLDPFAGYLVTRTTNYIDSNFYFTNESDTGATISYQWNFGDGTLSTDKNPKHSYSKRGKYTVTLVASNDQLTFDTMQQTVSVVFGQQDISMGDANGVKPVGIEETPANEFLVLANSAQSPYYHLFKVDSFLKKKSTKTFPANYGFTSIKATNDGNYILTGSTQLPDKANEIIKMAEDGTIIWSKLLNASEVYRFAAPTADGGYVVVGYRPVLQPFGNIIDYAVVTKTDNNGNVQWQKLLDQEGMIFNKGAVVESDGFVLAGTKRKVNGQCFDCDSVMILKLDHVGNLVWKNAAAWGFNTNVIWDARISKQANGNYVVNNGYSRGFFFFSPTGAFLDRKLAPFQVSWSVGASDGNVVLLLSEGGNGNTAGMAKYNSLGVQQWHAIPDGRQKMTSGYSCCSSSWPVAILPLKNGGTISTGYRINNNASGSGSHAEIFLLELDDEGKVK